MMNKLKGSSPLTLNTHCKLYIDIYMLKKAKKAANLNIYEKAPILYQTHQTMKNHSNSH